MLNLPSVTNSLALLLASVRSELLMAGVPLQSSPTDTGAILGKHDVLRGCGTAAGDVSSHSVLFSGVPLALSSNVGLLRGC